MVLSKIIRNATRKVFESVFVKDIVQSMSRKGDCLDNCKMETLFGHMKRETYCGNKFKTRQELFDVKGKYIKFYNEKRYQVKMKGLSPVDFRKQAS